MLTLHSDLQTVSARISVNFHFFSILEKDKYACRYLLLNGLFYNDILKMSIETKICAAYLLRALVTATYFRSISNITNRVCVCVCVCVKNACICVREMHL